MNEEAKAYVQEQALPEIFLGLREILKAIRDLLNR
jgi:hypothetical protein